MSLNVRMPTVEFRSLLLPPIRVSLRAFRSVARPRCAHQAPHATPHAAQCLAQLRSLHLYKSAKAKTLLGQHKLMTFTPYKVAPPSQSQHKVNLVDSSKAPIMIAEDISLQELYDDYVKPGQMLHLLHNIPKAVAENVDKIQTNKTADEFRNYSLMKPHDAVKKGSKDITLRDQKGKQLGQLKCIMIRLSSPNAYFRHCMDRAYQFVQSGSPVEFRTRLRGSTAKIEKIQAGPIDKWQWMHDHWPHLRPDFILKSMPEGSHFLIDPVSDGYIVQFVISLKMEKMPSGNLNARLWKVKKGVTHSVKSGVQTQLPKMMRQQLVEQGSTDYSVNSGLPKSQALAGYTKDKSVAKWGFPEREVAQSTSPTGTMGFKYLDLGDRQMRKSDASPEFRDADAALVATEEAHERWRAEIRRRNAIYVPNDGLATQWTRTRQDGSPYKADKQPGEHDGQTASALYERPQQRSHSNSRQEKVDWHVRGSRR